jgi:hypothetical protein
MRIFGGLLVLLGSFFSSPNLQLDSKIKSPFENANQRAACIINNNDDSLWRSEKDFSIDYRCQLPSPLSFEFAECREGGIRGTWKACPLQGSYQLENLRSDLYSFEVRARVKQNNEWVYSPLYFWRVDHYAPTLLDFDYSFENNGSLFHYKAEARDSGGSGLAGWQCRQLPFSDWHNCESESQVDFSRDLGGEKWELRVLDRAGNASPAVSVDYPEPLRGIASQESICQWDRLGKFWVSQSSLTLSFTCMSSRPGKMNIEYRHNEEEWNPTPSSRHLRLEKLNDGEHQFYLRIKHEDQSTSRDFAFHFGVDTEKPKSYVTSAEQLNELFLAHITSNDLGGSGVALQECKLEKVNGRVLHDWRPCGDSYLARTRMYQVGQYKLSVRATDYAGNLSSVHERLFNIAEKNSVTKKRWLCDLQSSRRPSRKICFQFLLEICTLLTSNYTELRIFLPGCLLETT